VSEPAAVASPYAGLVTRAVALIVDALAIDAIALLTGGAINLVLSVFGASGRINLGVALAGGVAWFLWSGAYFVAFWTLTGQTPGARLMSIRVTGPSGRIGVCRAVRRFLGLILCLIPLGAGFIPVLFDDRRRGLHDRLAGTVVRWYDRTQAITPQAVASPPEALRSS
jgi:uncharacterized RDD family membrane protein YckC